MGDISTHVLRSASALHRFTRGCRDNGSRLVLVPTMGNLHEGHLSLVRRAKRYADRVLVSIFVNPVQFGPNEDFEHYPRTWSADLKKLQQEKVDAVFAPSVRTMYPHGMDAQIRITVPDLDTILCGRYRPGHFTGVATVIARLFALTKPAYAVFGQKDYQQLLVIRRLVADMDWPIRIIAHPVVREADGLALSSRNAYLSPDQRVLAPRLYKALQNTARVLATGRRDYIALQNKAARRLRREGFKPEYVSIRGLDLKEPPLKGGRLRILASAWLGKTRLIDNIAAHS